MEIRFASIANELNELSFTLDIVTTNTTPQHGTNVGRIEEPDSRIVSINVQDVFYHDNALDELVYCRVRKARPAQEDVVGRH